jgi:hypothetical protein
VVTEEWRDRASMGDRGKVEDMESNNRLVIGTELVVENLERR